MILSRRGILSALTAAIVASRTLPASGQEEDVPLEQIDDLDYPPFDAINPLGPLGGMQPDEEQRRKAESIWSGAPRGPRPIDVAIYFIDNFATSDPDAISQWPKADAWNPLVVEFFRATSYRAANDMVPWCAAFVNWCLLRTNRVGSGSASSQSFLNRNAFSATSHPKVGDLAVFTCYDVINGNSVGLGHVAFVADVPSTTHVPLIGGNQANGGKSMICRKPYPLTPVRTSRTIDGRKVPVTFKFNTYISID